jgi:hypothetical protein
VRGSGVSGRQPTVKEKSKALQPVGFHRRGGDGGHPDLAAREVSRQTAAHSGSGISGGPGWLSQRLAIPLHQADGERVAYGGRAVDRTEPRYRVPAGLSKAPVRFQLPRAAACGEQTALVEEGVFDCLRVHPVGFPAVVALMGPALYERQQWLLSGRFRDIVLMLDGGQAGRRARAMISARLAGRCPVRVIELAAGVQPDPRSERTIPPTLGKEGGDRSTGEPLQGRVHAVAWHASRASPKRKVCPSEGQPLKAEMSMARFN